MEKINILVAVDSSHQKERIIEQIGLVVYDQDELFILRVMDIPDYILNMPEYAKITRKTEAYLLDELAQIKESLEAKFPNLKVRTFLEKGKPKQKIVEFAANNEVEIHLIVIGVTGESEQNMAGSTTAYVVNHAPCHVLVIK